MEIKLNNENRIYPLVNFESNNDFHSRSKPTSEKHDFLKTEVVQV